MATRTAPKPADDTVVATPPPPPDQDGADEINDGPTGPVVETTSADAFALFPTGSGRGRKQSAHASRVSDYLSNPAPVVIRGMDNEDDARKYAGALRNAVDAIKDENKKPVYRLVWRYVPADAVNGGKPHPWAGCYVWVLEDRATGEQVKKPSNVRSL